MAFLSCDVDGFLLDTEFPLAEKVAEIATRAGFPVSAQEAFARSAGKRSEDKFRLLARMHRAELPPSTLTDLVAQHRAAKKEVYLGRNYIKAFPKVPEALQRLSQRGHGFWICSNGEREHITEALDELRLRHHFNDRVYTRVDVGNRMKPHPAMLLHAMKENGATADVTIHIGDTLTDARTGKRAGTASIIFVDPRFGKKWNVQATRMKQAGAFTVFRDFEELPDLVESCVKEMQPAVA